MDPTACREKKKYDTLWEFFPKYREMSPADALTPVFLDFFKNEINKQDHVIDFGCGVGRSAKVLLEAGLNPHLVDFSHHCLDPDIALLTLGSVPAAPFYQECLWSLSSNLAPAEWILCFDVLEHIPIEKIEMCLSHMAARMKKGGLINVSLVYDHHGSAINEKLHLTVKPAAWWKKRIANHFCVQELATTDKTLIWALRTAIS